MLEGRAWEEQRAPSHVMAVDVPVLVLGRLHVATRVSVCLVYRIVSCIGKMIRAHDHALAHAFQKTRALVSKIIGARITWWVQNQGRQAAPSLGGEPR